MDEVIRQEMEHAAARASMRQKEMKHLEAILASAAGYLEVNLTRDLILEQSLYLPTDGPETTLVFPAAAGTIRYSELSRWLCENRISEHKEAYATISNRDYLRACFERGETRVSVFFSARQQNGDIHPYQEVFFLYQDHASKDVIAFCVIYDLTEQQRREQELHDLEQELQMSRIRNSTSQMQPHFLYNALDSIQEIILDDPVYASELIGDFTIHLRSCIRAMTNDMLIPFTQELANIKAYVNIEKMRFGEKLRLVYDIPVTDFMILPLSVQPLVENAIRHGVYERGARGGTVTLRSRETADAWVVEVSDDGVGFDPAGIRQSVAAGQKDSTGLQNITFRLDKVMHAGVTIHSVPDQGTTVTIVIPKGDKSCEPSSSTTNP